MIKTYDTSVIDEIITGYLPRSIYAFETNTHPNYLKVGDTNRKVSIRINEWRRVYENLIQKYEAEAMLEDEYGEKTVFFRDYAVHEYLTKEKGYNRLSTEKYEKEFFEHATTFDIDEAVEDIKNDFLKDGIRKYSYYQVGIDNTQMEEHWKRTQDYLPRPNQAEAVRQIVSAVKNGRKNLLLYAVMRFGKSNVSIWAAKELDSKLTVIVTGKADVKSEWQKTVESHKDFENFIFTDVENFTEEFINENKFKNIVLFVTLQDLAGSREDIKAKHEMLFNSEIDFLVIDESHFGARAKIYSQVLIPEQEDEDFDELKEGDFNDALSNINNLKYDVMLHLSGTPYRILLSGEFLEEDIVGKVQFSDILEAKNEWIHKHIDIEEEKPWENPYFGFPEMIRFAFTPNKASIKLLDDLKQNGKSSDLNVLFAPESTSVSNARTVTFKYESEILGLLKAIDGQEEDESIFPFLNYKKIKDGKLTQHMVFVLPYKNSVDAMERLIIEHKDDFINLNSYEILNVAGNTSNFRSANEVKNRIKNLEEDGKKTITLTVNKMLTGSTIPEWDTMIFLKDTKSPQEYDQAIFRLQSPWIKEVVNTKTGEVIGKEDMKPQTLLIDFSPNRVFKIESERALVINASDGRSGNEHQIEELKRNIEMSPIICMNKDKLVEATPTDIIAKIREYSADKSIIDEVMELPIDNSLYNIPEVLAEILIQPELGSRHGFQTPAHEEEDTDLELDDISDGGNDRNGDNGNGQEELDNNISEEDLLPTVKQMQMYYSRILFYAFLSPNSVKNLADVIEDIGNNERLATHLDLRKQVLEILKANINPFVLAPLDNKIENINDQRNDSKGLDILKSINKFDRISPNEIFTPIWVAKMMVDKLIDEEFIKDYIDKPKKIIDLSSKSGVYLIMVYQKLVNSGIDKEVLKDKLFAVATSHIGYEFTRVVYEEFNWKLDCLANSDIINSYQLIEEDEPMQKLLEIFGGDDLKFDVVIGNPPYQEEAKGTSSSDDPIYHLFMQEAYKLSDKAMFITPARFLFNAGKTPTSWNNEMLNDKHLSVEYYEQDTGKIFPQTSIPGGVVVTYRDTSTDYGKIGTFVSFPELNTIMKKVWKTHPKSIMEIIYTQSKFNLEILYQDYPHYKDIIGSNGRDKRFRQIIMERLDVFTEMRKNSDDIRVFGLINRNRTYRYIPKKYVEDTDWLGKYKVFVPFSNGASGTLGDRPARMISTPVLGLPQECMTQTFIGFGAYSTEIEGKNLLLYIKSKFARAMLGILKVTQGNKADTWKYVPLQDFSNDSDIDWSKTASEIDEQLYKKYGLDNKEINFIEEKLQEME